MNGEPLHGATVEFIPVDQTILNTRTGAITDTKGKISLPKSRGLDPGEYIVTIYATIEWDSRTKKLADMDTPPTSIRAVVLAPPEYNTKSILRFTVTKKGPNVYSCDIKSDASRDYPQDRGRAR